MVKVNKEIQVVDQVHPRVLVDVLALVNLKENVVIEVINFYFVIKMMIKQIMQMAANFKDTENPMAKNSKKAKIN